jgi:hypothetical protein
VVTRLIPKNMLLAPSASASNKFGTMWHSHSTQALQHPFHPATLLQTVNSTAGRQDTNTPAMNMMSYHLSSRQHVLKLRWWRQDGCCFT